MANIILQSDSQTSATSVSNIFIDEYMPDANGEFVKIYLYLLRQLSIANAQFSLTDIADKFEHTEKDIKRALNYWERMHLLHLDYDEEENLIGISFLPILSKKCVCTSNEIHTAAPPPKQEPPTPADIKPMPAQPKNYSAEDISMFRRQEPVAELLFIAERYLARMLTSTDINSILYFYDEIGFSTDLIEYLIEYCVSKGHKSIRYIEKVALSWAENGISTVEQAKQASSIYNQTYFAVMKALGINGRNLIPSETAYIDKWTSEYKFSTELITAACERTIQKIHKPEFNYIDSILSNWKKEHAFTMADISKLDEAHEKQKKAAAPQKPAAPVRNKFNNFEQRSYDADQLEKMLLTTSAPAAPARNKFNNFEQRSYDFDQLEKMLLTTSVPH